MGISGKWYDPITYQLSISCIVEKNEQNQLLNLFQSLLNEIKPYILQEMLSGRQFHGIVADKIVSEISGEDELLQFERLLTHETRQIKSPCYLFSNDFLPFDVVPTKHIDKEWKNKVSTLMDLKQTGNIPSEQYMEWLQELLNTDSDKLEGICFPKSCFMPHPYIFFLGFKTIRCQSREEYELFQESGALDNTNHRGHPSCVLQTLHLSIPRFFFHDRPQSFPLQNMWVDHIKELCSSIEISVGSIKADIMYNDIYENPLYTFFNSFKQGFRQRIGEIGWGMCFSKKQAELLGGTKALLKSNVFFEVHSSEDGHVYAQLTPSLLEIPSDRVKKLWALLSPYIRTVSGSSHSIGDLPISVRLGIDRGNIAIMGDGSYSLCLL